MQIPKLSEVRKAVAALAAGVAVMVAAGLITGDLASWVTGAIAAVMAALATSAAPRNTDPEALPTP